MQKHEEWLWERLPEWESEGLLDSASAERLRKRYEKEARPVASSGNLAIFILSAMGAFLVGLGVIALFAANWGAMSRGLRAGISLLPLTICTLLAMTGFARGWKAHAFWEALGIGWTLAIWSGFGLVCQTYHISDDVSGFVLACTLLCLPVLYLTQSAVATVVWPIFGLVWLWMNQYNFTFLYGLSLLTMLVAHLPIFILIHRHIKFRGLYEFFGVNSIAAALVSILILSEKNDSIWLLAFLWMEITLWILSEWTKWRPLRLLCFLYLLPVLLIVPIPAMNFLYELKMLFSISMLGVTALTLAGGILLMMRKGDKQLSQEKRFQIIVILFGLLAAVIVYLLNLPHFLLYLLILIVSILSLVQALRKLRLFQMNLSLCVLIYEILVKYLASDWSFTAKGLILLSCGIALLLSNVFIIRRRRQAVKEVEQ